MRKMKKFLAVALSAAMVLSVSVPAMAAETPVLAAASSAEEDLEKAIAKEEAAQEAYDAAEDELRAALEVLDMAYDSLIPAPSEEELEDAKDEVDAYAEIAKEAKEDLAIAEDYLAECEAAELEAKKDYEAKKALYDAAAATVEEIQAALDEPLSEERRAALEEMLDEANEVLEDAEGALEDAEEAYVQAQEDTDEAEADVEDAQEALNEANADLRDARQYYTALLHQDALASDSVDAIAAAEELVKEAQANLQEALDALNEAKAERRAAEAKLDTANQAVSEAKYNQAVAKEQLTANTEAKAKEALDEAIAELEEIEAEIAAAEATIAAAEDAEEAADAAATAAAEAALALSEAEEAFDEAKAALEICDFGNNVLIPELIERIEEAILMATAMDELISTDPMDYLVAVQRIAQLQEELDRVFEDLIPAADWATTVAIANYNKAVDAVEEAAGNWAAAEIAAQKADDEAWVAAVAAVEAEELLPDLEADLEEAQEVVDELQDAYDEAKARHEQALAELAAAIAEYEYYHGYKPGEEPQPQPTPVVTDFTDVPADSWFAPYVADVVAKGIMKGMNATTFGSYAPLQRQDFCLILWRMAGEPKVVGAPTFTDVKSSDYFAQAVAWAASTGIMKGYASTDFTVFGVGDDITREDFAVALHRFYNYPTSAQSLDGFADANKVSLYAKDAVKWAVETGAITGKDGGTKIDPQAAIARCEAAKIFSVITDVA